MPFKSSNEIRRCKWCNKPAKKYYQGSRFKGYLKTCGSEECLKKQYNDNNISKSKIYNKIRICEICKKYDLVSPIYKTSFRGGCWFCPKQSIKQLRWLYKYHRDLWNILKDMEKDSFNTFKPNTTIKQLEERFINEDKQISIFDIEEEIK